MAEKFTRQALYDLVWTTPKTTLATELGISDVGLGKICREANIPIPFRGYWARVAAGQTPLRIPLPARGLGQKDEVMIGRQAWSFEEQIVDIPPRPIFTESLSDITQRAQKILGKVTISKTLSNPHPLIAKLLTADEKRRQDFIQSPYEWNKPLFDDPISRRRLKIINALFLIVSKGGFKPYLRGGNADELGVLVGKYNVSFSLKKIEQRSGKEKSKAQKACLQLDIANGSGEGEFPIKHWSDTEGTLLETHLLEIATNILVAGEMHYRRHIIWNHDYLVERKAEQEEKIREAEEKASREAEEARIENQQRLREALLAAADNRQKATTLRTLVSEAEQQSNVVSAPGFESWRAWVLAEADQLDPFSGGLEALLSSHDLIAGSG